MASDVITVADIRDQLCEDLQRKELISEDDKQPLLAIVKDRLIEDLPKMHETIHNLNSGYSLAAFGRDNQQAKDIFMIQVSQTQLRSRYVMLSS